MLNAPEHGIDYVERHILQDYADFDQLEVTDPYKNPKLAPDFRKCQKALKDRPGCQYDDQRGGPGQRPLRCVRWRRCLRMQERIRKCCINLILL